MTDLTTLTISQATDGLKNKEFTAVELTQSYIDQMEKTRSLGAYITETPELALENAKKADENIAVVICDQWKVCQLHTKICYVQRVLKQQQVQKCLIILCDDYESTVSQNCRSRGDFIG